MKDKRRDSDERMTENMQKNLSSGNNDVAADDRKRESAGGDGGATEEPRAAEHCEITDRPAGSTSTYS